MGRLPASASRPRACHRTQRKEEMRLHLAIAVWAVMLQAGCATGRDGTAGPRPAAETTAVTGEEPLRTYECRYVTNPPVLDGCLADPCWAGARSASVASDAPTRSTVKERARFRMLWDDVYLYFAAEAFDDFYKATHSTRDSRVWQEDCIEIYLDVEGRKGRYYEMDFNSAGVIWDSMALRHRDGRVLVLKGWTPASLEVATARSDSGWVLEGRIRLDEFVGADGIPPGHGDMWRGNVYYIDYGKKKRDVSYVAWQPTTDCADTAQFGEILFLDPAGAELAETRRKAARAILASGPPPDALPLTARIQSLHVFSPGKGPFREVSSGWKSDSGNGRFTRRPDDADPVHTIYAHPAGHADPTVAEWKAERNGELIVLGRLQGPQVKAVRTGRADGVWVHVAVDGKVAQTVRLAASDWLGLRVPYHKGQKITLTVDPGPAKSGNYDSTI